MPRKGKLRQQELQLRFRGRGGRREGAGRPRGENPRIRHLPRERFTSSCPCHVTLKVQEDIPSLRIVKLVRELERTLARGCERGEFRVVHYSLQRDHAHFLVEAKSRAALGRGMKSLGARFARAVNRVFERRGAVLRDRYHLHVLRSPREVRNALRYVLLNHRKHARRKRRAVQADPASSGRFFDGWREKLGIAPGEAPVASAHTWLLSKGWRRAGGLFSLSMAKATRDGVDGIEPVGMARRSARRLSRGVLAVRESPGRRERHRTRRHGTRVSALVSQPPEA